MRFRILSTLMAWRMAWSTEAQVDPITLHPTLQVAPVLTAEAQRLYAWYDSVLTA
jgi:hypothetical protein